MDSGTVRGYAFQCHRLQAPAQECSDKMTQAIAGLSDYWVDLGGEEFKQNCGEWIKKMNKFKTTIAQIELGMMKYANELQKIEEDRIKEAQKQAVNAKMTGKIK